MKNRERILESRKRVPVGTRYVFCGQGHTVLDTWKTEGGGLTHEIVNEEKNGQGELLFAKGEAYTLEEIVVFSDGTEFLSGRVSVSIGENGKMILADLKNKGDRRADPKDGSDHRRRDFRGSAFHKKPGWKAAKGNGYPERRSRSRESSSREKRIF